MCNDTKNINNNAYNIVPIKTYTDLYNNKKTIYDNNRNKSAIYRWNNIVTGASYIGSSVNLTRRLSNYFSTGFLNKELLKSKSRISSSLLEYGYSNFTLDVIEYCERDSLNNREQYFMDILKPEYNILKTAGSRLGSKHSAETLLNYKNRKLSSKALVNLKKSKTGISLTSPLRKINQLLATGHPTTVVNKENNTIKLYSSIRAAARELGTSHNSLLNYINTDRLYKDVYLIIKNYGK